MNSFSLVPSGRSPVTPPAHDSPGYAHDLWRLGLILGVFFFAFLGDRPLSNTEEGRHAEIPREMAATGDFVTPRLDGVKYFEKPPLVYWLSAVTCKVAGVNEWTARAVSCGACRRAGISLNTRSR